MPAAPLSAVYVPLMLSSLALAICVVSFFILRAYLRQRTSREWILQDGILTEIRDEVNKLLKSIDETTDRDISLIEEREKRLKSLLEEIEKRLNVYIREMDKRKDAEVTYAALSPAPPAGGQEAPGSGGGTYSDLGKKRYKSGSTFPLPSFSVKAEAEPAPSLPSPPAGAPPTGEQIRSLIREGFPVQTIASRLGISIAEVEFTAALLERRNNQ